MFWSVSSAKAFRRCQRQWYYAHKLAHWKAKDPERRRAYRLSQLTTIQAWRGQIVDDVLSKTLIDSLKSRHSAASKHDLIGDARIRFDRELVSARDDHQRLWAEKFKADSGPFFLCKEYDGTIADEEIKQAWRDVEKAIENLYSNELNQLRSLIKSTQWRVAQRTLQIPHSGVNVRGTPDLILFFPSRPPVIVDWKVHTLGVRDAWRQLTTYAFLLVTVEPHFDFPKTGLKFSAHEVELIEAQLLLGIVRTHQLRQEDVVEVEDHIAASAMEMELALDGDGDPVKVARSLPRTRHREACLSCAFRGPCWQEEESE